MTHNIELVLLLRYEKYDFDREASNQLKAYFVCFRAWTGVKSQIMWALISSLWLFPLNLADWWLVGAGRYKNQFFEAAPQFALYLRAGGGSGGGGGDQCSSAISIVSLMLWLSIWQYWHKRKTDDGVIVDVDDGVDDVVDAWGRLRILFQMREQESAADIKIHPVLRLNTDTTAHWDWDLLFLR